MLVELESTVELVVFAKMRRAVVDVVVKVIS